MGKSYVCVKQYKKQYDSSFCVEMCLVAKNGESIAQNLSEAIMNEEEILRFISEYSVSHGCDAAAGLRIFEIIPKKAEIKIVKNISLE